MTRIKKIFQRLFISRETIALILFVFISSVPIASQATPQTQTPHKFLVLTIDDKIISPVIADYISWGIDKACQENFSGVIIMLDTPGGLLESTRAIVKKIMNAEIPIITYVAPSGSRASSAGVFITLASHVAAMAPSTNIGAAHPVTIGNNDSDEKPLKKAIDELTEVLKNQRPKIRTKIPQNRQEKQIEESTNPMTDKIMNDTLAWITTIAQSRNRNSAWAKKAVSESVSTTEKEALENNIIDYIALDTNDLLKQLNAKTITTPSKKIILNTQNASLIPANMTLSQNLLNTIINPNIAYILMLAGFLGLFIEITHPGVILPGIIGVLCLVLAFYAFAMLPVNFAGFLLIGLALIFFIAEAFTPASFGLLTISGVVAMLIGSLMLINSRFLDMSISLYIILPFALGLAAIVVFLASNVIKSHRKKILTGVQTLIGQTAIAQTDILEEGQIFLQGEIWSAINPSKNPIKKGEKIKVLGVDKTKLLVSK